jgi:hypothetical protein
LPIRPITFRENDQRKVIENSISDNDFFKGVPENLEILWFILRQVQDGGRYGNGDPGLSGPVVSSAEERFDGKVGAFREKPGAFECGSV